MYPAPLQIPGAIELAVILLIFLILAVPIVALVLAIRWYRGRPDTDDATEERIEELEAEVAELKSELEATED